MVNRLLLSVAVFLGIPAVILGIGVLCCSTAFVPSSTANNIGNLGGIAPLATTTPTPAATATQTPAATATATPTPAPTGAWCNQIEQSVATSELPPNENIAEYQRTHCGGAK